MSDDTRSRDITQPLDKLHPNERLKHDSDYLRGSLKEGLADPITGAVSDRDTQLTKFHGIYQQDDRDLRNERRRQMLEPAYEFMVRVRLPGGVCSTQQWLALDDLARRYANGTLRLTTRQTFQFHGILKRDLKTTIQGINNALLDTIAACGDDNRGVMCSVNPHESEVHAQVQQLAHAVSDHLRPRSRAYHEIWLDEERVAGGEDNPEPLYGPTYLPRKFKIGFAVPPTNDIDVYSQDVGFIAITEDGALSGFNICVGGGMGRTDNDRATYPRLADVIGFCRPEQVTELAETIVAIQRDYGDRVNRAHARMKYTIDDRGLDWFTGELHRRMGRELEAARDYRFAHNGDRYGWAQGADGRWHFTLFVENGRVKDDGELQLMSGLRAIAHVHDGEYRITGNQNLVIAGVAGAGKARIEELLEAHGILAPARYTALRRNAMACVAFPTCGLAMAESERYLPEFIDQLEGIAEQAGVAEVPIIVRMTGCPNGCARPYLGEIGLTGRGPGKYDLFLGAGFQGQRLAKPYAYNIDTAQILEILTPMIQRFGAERQADEAFGDFLVRTGEVAPVEAGRSIYD